MRICSGAGCLRAVPDSIRFCDECAPEKPVSDDLRNHTSGYDAELDAMRKTTRWQKLRLKIIRRDPICKRCDCRISEIVDHIVPALIAVVQARDSGRYFDRNAGYYFESNLQGLCRPCHWVKTNEDKTHTGEWPDVVSIERLAPKRKWIFA